MISSSVGAVDQCIRNHTAYYKGTDIIHICLSSQPYMKSYVISFYINCSDGSDTTHWVGSWFCVETFRAGKVFLSAVHIIINLTQNRIWFVMELVLAVVSL
jgi:hypothetical protein